MQNGIAADGVCSSESANGSRDVWSCKGSDSSSADHLVIMVHGILGSSSDWKFGAEQFVKRLPDKPPLLKRMLDDYDEFYFMSALRTFKRRVLYSNVAYDHIVGWRTSSIRRDSELPKWEEFLNETYPHIVYEEHCKACDADQHETISIEDDGSSDKLEEELVRGLSRVSWEKIDVSFQSSRQRFAAHSVIQVKDEVMHIEGADVIEHMIDHFLT
ncbi:serine esterase family protein [Gossypium australe]|uniref:Serine esterase family protein n=1 Tax=Gossypium australe TaxID=47621 RepID=A0A5B6UWG9_9ROSI|nr:serine esterase family protein [Gossypium australe]